MIPIYVYPAKEIYPEIVQRPDIDTKDVEKAVSAVLKKVKQKGDAAVRRFTREFDGVMLKRFAVTEKEIAEAEKAVPAELQSAIMQAAMNIRTFHESQYEKPHVVETMPGIRCWRKSMPIEKVGLYIPGGTAPLFSTVLMLGIPAFLAGCTEVVLCSPPGSDGRLHPAILFAAKLVGTTKIFKCGGAQAIAAMAYGTESIPQVHKLFGPGNRYVTCAKQLVQREGIAIDMPAGPSEIAIYADDSANPVFVAADLLSQAEHGTDSQVVLITNSELVLAECLQEVEKQLEELPRRDIAAAALRNGRAVVVKHEDEAITLINEYAPEHLLLNCFNAENMAEHVRNAGSVFIGKYSPESVGDYASGTNHTLPTHGFARAYSGVSLDSFVKKITYQQLTAGGLSTIGPLVEVMAEAEGLMAHKRAVSVRLNAIREVDL